MDAESEQLHAVLAVEPSCRIVVVACGDLGDQAYLLRTGGCPAVGPRHGSPASAKYYVIQLPIVHSGFVAFFSMRAHPSRGKTVSERTEPLPGPVGEAHMAQSGLQGGSRPAAPSTTSRCASCPISTS